MNILVTGGAGYIGSHTAKQLANQGHKVFVYDNLCRGHKEFVKWGEFVEGDLEDRELILKTLKRNKIDAVVHFAAHSLVGESVEKPELYFKNNVMNTMSLLDAMDEANVKTIVFSSTAATYGNPEEVPIPEDHPQKPINPYGESKVMIERTLDWYGKLKGLKWVALRYFNAAGADPDCEVGEKHFMETHLIPIVLQTLTGKRDHVGIFGTDYATPDGTAVRDYIHVTDLAEAHVLALKYLQQGGDSSMFNLGTGNGYSVREVIKTVEKVTEKDVPVKEEGRRAGDPPSLVAKADRAKEILGWTPQYSDLETIVKTAWQWEQKQ